MLSCRDRWIFDRNFKGLEKRYWHKFSNKTGIIRFHDRNSGLIKFSNSEIEEKKRN